MYLEKLDNFFSLWNGAWWQPSVACHYCAGPSCCSTRADTAKRMAAAAEALLFQRQPPDIAANKWSRLGPVIDWLLLAQLCHKLLLAGMRRLGTSIDHGAGGNPCDQDEEQCDPALKQEREFSILKGKRYLSSRSFLADTPKTWTVLFVAIAIEGHRYLTSWWMRRARETDRTPARIPFLDALFPKRFTG